MSFGKVTFFQKNNLSLAKKIIKKRYLDLDRKSHMQID